MMPDAFYRPRKLCLCPVTKEWAFPAGFREKLPLTWIQPSTTPSSLGSSSTSFHA